MTSSSFSRRHYEQVERLISSIAAPRCRAEVAAGFAVMFAADNPKFSQDRFMKACGCPIIEQH